MSDDDWKALNEVAAETGVNLDATQATVLLSNADFMVTLEKMLKSKAAAEALVRMLKKEQDRLERLLKEQLEAERYFRSSLAPRSCSSVIY